MKTQLLRKLFFAVLTSFVLVAFVGCDSDDEDPEDVFEGTWALTGIEDTVNGDLTPVIQQTVNSLVVTFEANGDFDLLLDYNELAEAAGATDIALAGTYSATETRLTLVIPDRSVSFPLDYTVISNDQLELSGSADLVNQIFGTEVYQGTVTITITRQ